MMYNWVKRRGDCLHRAIVETLEQRRLLAYTPGPTSAQVGDDLFYIEINGDDAGLWKSDLDGSNAALLKTWSTPGPSWLTAHNGELYFSANYTNTSYSGNELWKSDGTPDGTILVRDIYGGSQGSWPYDFRIISGNLVFTAKNNSISDQIFGTDGTRDGTVQLLTPGVQQGYYGSPIAPEVVGNRLIAQLYHNSKDQYELWQTDGTPAGTLMLGATAMIRNGELQVYGTDDADAISVFSAQGKTNVVINGTPAAFQNADFTGIVVHALSGDDTVLVHASITDDVTIHGGSGNDTLGGGSGDDSILDNSGSDSLAGAAGNDYLYDSGDDYERLSNSLRGGEGNDTLSSYWGDDLLEGADGHDSISSGFGDDTVLGGAGNDTIDGGYDDDSLVGGDGDDVLTDPSGNNSLAGNNGSDSLSANGGEDTLDGGNGADTISAGWGLDSILSDAADTVTDSPAIDLQSNQLDITGTHGNDVIVLRLKDGSPGMMEAIVNGSTSAFNIEDVEVVRIATGAGDDQINVDPNLLIRTWLLAGAGNDTIDGSAGNDTIEGGTGDDSILGNGGDDQIDPGLGNDTVDGGAGIDRLNYRLRRERILKTANELVIRTDAGEADSFVRLEGIVAGYGDDVIASNRSIDGLNYFSGRQGNDTITVLSAAGMSAAQIYGEDGDDTLTGSTADAIEGGAGTNTIYAIDPAAPAWSVGLAGGILRINGTEAGDQIILVRSPSQPHRLKVAVNGQLTVVNVADVSTALIHGLGGDDVIRVDQRYGALTFGTRMYGEGGNDTMAAGNGADRIYGGDGHDWLGGYAGNDVIYGEAGNDRLFGADGRDYLVAGAGSDVIRGEAGVDQILGTAGEDDFRGNAGDLITLVTE